MARKYHPRTIRLSDGGRRLLGNGLAAVGFALLATVLLQAGIQGAGGSGGIDAIAYWSAAGRALRGEPLYEAGSNVGQFAAYQYPPPFAQLLAPLSLLPMPAFVWLWRGVELVGLRLAVGSWRRAGIAILVFPPVIAEIDAANVHLVMAGLVAVAMRGVGGVTAPAMLLKFASWPLMPHGWRHDRRGLVRGGLAAAGIGLASLVLTFDSWLEYRSFLATAQSPDGSYNLAVGVPLALRLAIAGTLGLLAVRWVRLAPVAVTLAYPVVWLHGLSTLVAVATPVVVSLTMRAPDRTRRSPIGVMVPATHRASVPVMAPEVAADRSGSNVRETVRSAR